MRNRLLRWSLAALVAGTPVAAEAADDEARRPGEAETLLRNTADGWSVGDRLRVTLAGMDGSTVGRFSDLRGDTLYLSIPGVSRPLPVRANQLGAIEEVGGRKRHLKQGIVIGAIVGGAAGAIAGAASEQNQSDASDSFGDWSGFTTAAGFLIGFAGGAVLGGVIGYTITTDRWVVTAQF